MSYYGIVFSLFVVVFFIFPCFLILCTSLLTWAPYKLYGAKYCTVQTYKYYSFINQSLSSRFLFIQKFKLCLLSPFPLQIDWFLLLSLSLLSFFAFSSCKICWHSTLILRIIFFSLFSVRSLGTIHIFKCTFSTQFIVVLCVFMTLLKSSFLFFRTF